jgi:hypothetical protein
MTKHIALIEDFEAAELFAAMIGRPEPKTDAQINALDDECIERFGIDLMQFNEIVSCLLPFCEHRHLAFSGATARGFAKDEAFICKVYDDQLSEASITRNEP